MIRSVTILLLALGIAVAVVPASAQTVEAPRQTRKAAKTRKAIAPQAAPVAGGINRPSTDFSKIERADEEPRGPAGPSIRPTMGAGGMGLGTGF